MSYYDDLIDKTLDNLLEIKENEFKLFFNTYRSLPLAIYKEIERLAVSKCKSNSKVSKKARKVSNAFHKSIK